MSPLHLLWIVPLTLVVGVGIGLLWFFGRMLWDYLKNGSPLG